jgi:hypothetical protein
VYIYRDRGGLGQDASCSLRRGKSSSPLDCRYLICLSGLQDPNAFFCRSSGAGTELVEDWSEAILGQLSDRCFCNAGVTALGLPLVDVKPLPPVSIPLVGASRQHIPRQAWTTKIPPQAWAAGVPGYDALQSESTPIPGDFCPKKTRIPLLAFTSQPPGLLRTCLYKYECFYNYQVQRLKAKYQVPFKKYDLL